MTSPARRPAPWGAGWRRWVADGAIALGTGAVQLGLTAAVAAHQGRSVPVTGWLVLAGAAAVLVARRRFPVGVLWATWVLTLAYWSTHWQRGPIFEAQIVALVSAVLAGRRRAAVASLVTGFVAFLWLPAVLGTHHAPTAVQTLTLAAWLGLLLVGSEWLRARRQRASAVAARREEQAGRVASEERLRIARELHDVLAHSISLINVQASTALYLAEREPDRAVAALATIKDASKEALAELRGILGVLHEAPNAPRSPAPTLARLDDLVARSRAAGVQVVLERDGGERLPRPVDQAAYRIVQEALTNVARHAPGSAATVRITADGSAVVVEVEDDGAGRPTPPVANGGGHGLAGMRERAKALGGNLQAGPRAAGGFRVRAWLPVSEGR